LEEHYQLQVEKLQELENMSKKGEIELYYGDETHVCSEGYVPYGWQFSDEDVCFLSEKAYKFNCFGFINRNSQCRWKITQENIDTAFVVDFLDKFSFEIQRTTFLVLDNAKIHKTKAIKERIPYWQKRGLFLFFLPPYSPHLNIAETLWRKLKKEWLDPADYLTKDDLEYALNRCLADMGKGQIIKFSHFNAN
jgi:transposase